MLKIPRKLKKEIDKIVIYRCMVTGEESIKIVSNVKINKWTLKLLNKVKEESKRAKLKMWKDVCDEFFNPQNRKNKERYFKDRFFIGVDLAKEER